MDWEIESEAPDKDNPWAIESESPDQDASGWTPGYEPTTQVPWEFDTQAQEGDPAPGGNLGRLGERFATRGARSIYDFGYIAAKQDPTVSDLAGELTDPENIPAIYPYGLDVANWVTSNLVKGAVDTVDMFTEGDAREDMISAAGIVDAEAKRILGSPPMQYQVDTGNKYLDVGRKIGWETLEVVANMAPALLVGAATKNPSMTLGVMGIQIGGETYVDWMEKTGGDHKRSMAAAKFYTWAEVIPETVPVFAILKKTGAGQGMRRMLEATFGEGAQEVITEVLQSSYDKIQLEDMSLKEALLNLDPVQLAKVFAIGAAAGALLGTPGTVADLLAKPEPPGRSGETVFPDMTSPDGPGDSGPVISPGIKTLEENASAIDDAIATIPDPPPAGPPTDLVPPTPSELDLNPNKGWIDATQDPLIGSDEYDALPPPPDRDDEEDPGWQPVDTTLDSDVAPAETVDPETGEIIETRPGAVPTSAELHVEANKAASSPLNEKTPPTPAQIDANDGQGNYAKGHTIYDGLKISIENPAGSKRKPEWPALAHHYGDIKSTEGADGDPIDVFINKDNDYSDNPVFIINQTTEDGDFDEHKVMLGFATEAEARKGYLDNYSDWWVAPDEIPRLSMPELKDWLKSGDTTAPYEGETEAQASAAIKAADAKMKRSESAAKRYKQGIKPNESDDLITYIRKLGGINTDVESDVRGRLSHLNALNGMVGLPKIEQTGGKGMTLDNLGEILIGAGLLKADPNIGNGVDKSALLDLLFDAESGVPIFNQQTGDDLEKAAYDAEEQERFADALEAEQEADSEGIALQVESDNEAFLQAAQNHFENNKDYSATNPITTDLMARAALVDEDAMVDIASQDIPEDQVQAQLKQLIEDSNDAKTKENPAPGKPAPAEDQGRKVSVGKPAPETTGEKSQLERATFAEIAGTMSTSTVDIVAEAIEIVGAAEFERQVKAEIDKSGIDRGDRQAEMDSIEIEGVARNIVALDGRKAGDMESIDKKYEPAAKAPASQEVAPSTGKSLSGPMVVEFMGNRAPVASFEEASKKWKLLRDGIDEEVGAGASGPSGAGAKIFDANGKQIARISYNGRIWDMSDKPIEESGKKPNQEKPAHISQPMWDVPEALKPGMRKVVNDLQKKSMDELVEYAKKEGFAKIPHSRPSIIEEAERRWLEKQLNKPDTKKEGESSIDAEAHTAAASLTNDLTPPTEGQIEADNYKKGHPVIQGFDTSIENPADSKRRPAWPPLAHHYGDLTGTIGADGDPLDIFIKRDLQTIPDDNPIYIINQKNGRGFDEHKIMFGFDSDADAKKGYLDNYTKDFNGFGDMYEVTPVELRAWIDSKKTRKEFKPGPKKIPVTRQNPLKDRNHPDYVFNETGELKVSRESIADIALQTAMGNKDAATKLVVDSMKAGKARDSVVKMIKALSDAEARQAGFGFDEATEVNKSKSLAELRNKLNQMKLPELQKIARGSGLNAAGTVTQLRNRLVSTRDAIDSLADYTSFDQLFADVRADPALAKKMAEWANAVKKGSESEQAAHATWQTTRRVMRYLVSNGIKRDTVWPTEAEVEAQTELARKEGDERRRERYPNKAVMESVINTLSWKTDLIDGDLYNAALKLINIENSILNQFGYGYADLSSEPGTLLPEHLGKPVARIRNINSQLASTNAKLTTLKKGDKRANPDYTFQLLAGALTDFGVVADQTEAIQYTRDNYPYVAEALDRKHGEMDQAGLEEAAIGAKKEQSAEQTAVPKKPKSYGEKNSVFKKSDAEKARELLKKKLGQLNAGLDPEVIQAGVTLAGYHIEAGARSFADFTKAMIADLGEAVRPYLRSWYESTRYFPGFDSEGMSTAQEIENYVSSTSENMEPGGPDAAVQLQGDENVIPADAEKAGQDTGAAGGGTGKTGVERPGDTGFSEDISPLLGATSDSIVDTGEGGFRLDGGNAGGRHIGRGSKDSDERIQAGQRSAEQSIKADVGQPKAIPEPKTGDKTTLDRIDSIDITDTDLDNIRATVPQLYPLQQEDVLFAEKRLIESDKRGVLFTNGTGTGKTFSGLGVIKRMSRRGKNNILILVPGEKIASDWIKAGKVMNLNITKLKDTKDAGTGVTITTYANFASNNELAQRDWDAILPDETHYLMANEKGTPGNVLNRFRALTGHPKGKYQYTEMMEPELIGELKEFEKKIKAAGKEHNWPKVKHFEDKRQAVAEKLAERREIHDANRDQLWADSDTKGLFLSATPFAYDKNIDWAEGFLFDYGPAPTSGAYNTPDAKGAFFVEHFGYRMRVGKLTQPDAEVDSGLMQREFNTWLKKNGALSGRMLEVESDYSREFVAVDTMIGRQIDAGMEYISDQARNKELDPDLQQGYGQIQGWIKEYFDYHQRIRLLEAIKARHAVERMSQHIQMGRKVVLFHSRIKGGSLHPFIIPIDDPNSNMAKAVMHFQANTDFPKLDLTSLISPLALMEKEFGDEIVFYNGTVSKKLKIANPDRFNEEPEVTVLMAQDDAGKEGVSLHDTVGDAQRVMMNIGLPIKPTQAIQIEGRIYRVGQMSDAIFEYFNTGTNFERWTFASKIARRADTTENLAMGEQARNLIDSFINAFEEPTYDPPHTGQGVGGKSLDRADNSMTDFQKAKTHYFAQQKKGGRRDQREGTDYYSTPEPIGLKMVEWAHMRGGESALEPSAGHGAIARYFPENVRGTFIEPSNTLASKLALKVDSEPKTQRFEDLNLINKFESIVMNPPYGAGGKTAMEHLGQAINHLSNGGRVVALIPDGPASNKHFENLMYGKPGELEKMKEQVKAGMVSNGEYIRRKDQIENTYVTAVINLPPVTFTNASSSVRTKVVILDKNSNPDNAPLPQSDVDIKGGKIGELFDNIEHLEVPEKADITLTPEKVLAGNDLEITPYGEDFSISGKGTFDNRNEIKAAGFRWARGSKAWVGEQESVSRLVDILLGNEPAALETRPEDATAETQGVVDDANTGALADYKLKVTKTTTNKGNTAFEVTGEGTRAAKDYLKALGARWYGPKKAWSFYGEINPTDKILAALGKGISDETKFSREDLGGVPRDVVDIWIEFAKHDEALQYRHSDKRELRGIVKDIGSDFQVSEVENKRPGIIRSFHIYREGEPPARVNMIDDGTVELNISLRKKNTEGSKIYHMVATYAYNNNLVFIGDRSGLSPDAFYRRTENMTNSALRFGTTRHLRPHIRQGVDWVAGEHRGNTARLIEKHYDNARKIIPWIENIRYDFVDSQFYEHGKGREVTDQEFKDQADKALTKIARAGPTTLKRLALTNTFMQASPAVRRRIFSIVGEQLSFDINPQLAGTIYSKRQKTIESQGKIGLNPEVMEVILRKRLGNKTFDQLTGKGNVRIIGKRSELPRAAQHPLGGEKGVYHKDKQGNKTVYLVSENITKDEAYGILLHETGVHDGLLDMVGEELFYGVMSEMVRSTDPRIIKARRRVPGDTKEYDIPEETLAYLVQDPANHNLPILQKLWAAIRDYFRKLGVVKTISVEDMAYLVGKAVVSKASEAVQGDPASQPALTPVAGYARERESMQVQHGASAANIIHADKMGGLAAPSLAIVDSDRAFTRYGSITLVGDTSMVDPKATGNRTYNADIYSPRYPTVARRISRSKLEELERDMASSSEFNDTLARGRLDLNQADIESSGANALYNNPAIQHHYLTAVKGGKVRLFKEPKITLPDWVKPFIPPLRRAYKAQKLSNGKFVVTGPAYRGEGVDRQWVANTYPGNVYDVLAEAQERARQENRQHRYKSFDMQQLAHSADFIEATRAARKERYSSIDRELIAKGEKPIEWTERETINIGFRYAGDIRASMRDNIDVARVRDSMRERIYKDAGYDKFISDTLAAITEKEMINEGYTSGGNPRSPRVHTIENVLNNILRADVQGGENFNYGVSSLRGTVAREFRDLEDIRQNRDMLVDKERMEELSDQTKKEFDEIRDHLSGYYRYSDDFSDIVPALTAFSRGNKRKFGESYRNIPGWLKDDITRFMSKLRHMETQYFESKPARIIQLSEFKGAVVPFGSKYKEVVETLEGHGVRVRRYANTGKEAGDNRARAARSFKNTLFSRGIGGRLAGMSDAVRKELGGREEEITALSKKVDAAYERGELGEAERMDGQLEAMREEYEYRYDAFNESDAQRRNEEDYVDIEGELERDLAARYYSLFVDKTSYENDDAPRAEKISVLRSVASEYGVMRDGVTDKQVFEAALDAHNRRIQLRQRGKVAANSATNEIIKEAREYEGRLWGGAYGAGYLRTSAKDAPKRKMIAAARKRYNELRAITGLPKVTDWNTRPEKLIQFLTPTDELVRFSREPSPDQLSFDYKQDPEKQTPADGRAASKAKKWLYSWLARRNGSVLANRISRNYARQGFTPLIGEEVTSHEDLANLAEIYRNPLFETFRLFFVKGNEIVGQAGITSRLPGAVALASSKGEMASNLIGWRQEMKNIGADGFYLLHNHPSGNPKPSSEDHRVTRAFLAGLDGYRGHVIINGSHYTVIDDRGEYLTHVKRKPKDNAYTIGEDPVKPHGALGTVIASPMDVIAVAMAVDGDEGSMQIIGRNSGHGLVTGIMSIPTVNLPSKPTRKEKIKMLAELRAFALQTSSGDLFAVNVPNRMKPLMHEAISTGVLLDAAIGQGVHMRSLAVKEGATKNKAILIRSKSLRVGEDAESIVYEAEPSPSINVEDMALTDKVVRKFQDKFIRLKQAQAAVLKAGGEVDIDSDAYIAETKLHGKIENDLRLLEENILTPLLDALAHSGVTQEELDEFLIAKHAPERNAYIAEINPKMQDGGSGITDAQAEAIIQSAIDLGKYDTLEGLAERVYRLLAVKRDYLQRYNLMKDETIDQWRDRYEFYVPLKGFAEDALNEEGKRNIGKGLNVKYTEPRALGRNSLPASPLVQAVKDTSESFITSRKNEVGLHFLRMVANNPDPKLWKIFTDGNPDRGRGIERTPMVDDFGNPVLNEEGKQVYNTTVKNNVPINMRGNDDYFGVKYKGKQYYIKLLDKDLKRAMSNLGVETQDTFVKVMGAATRYLSTVVTSMDPQFIVSNFMRDFQTAMFNINAEYDIPNSRINGKRIAMATAKGVPHAIKIIYKMARNESHNTNFGIYRPDPITAKYYDEFRADGAKTGFFDSPDIEGHQRRITRLVGLHRQGVLGTTERGLMAIHDFITDSNTAVENGVRLSAYIEARKALEPEVGEDAARKMAANLAKNLTVNFNKRGESTTMINSLYMFFNASVQGMATFGRAVFFSKRGAKMAGGLAIAAWLNSMLQRAISDDDEDGNTVYDNIPDYVKERNAIFMNPLKPDEYFKIPLPYGYNVFWNIGTEMESMVLGPQKATTAAKNLAMSFVGSFNPINLSQDDSVGATLFKSIIPTVGKPFVELNMNSNFFGGRIFNDPGFYSETPRSSLSMRGTPEFYPTFAKMINRLGGGDKYISSWLDFSPEHYEYLVEFVGGGALKTANQTINMVDKLVDGRDLQPREIPFFRKVYGKNSVYGRIDEFYTKVGYVSQISKGLKQTDQAERSLFKKVHEPYDKLIPALKMTRSRLSMLRKRRLVIERDESLTGKERDDQVNEVLEQMNSARLVFLKKYAELESVD